MRVLVGWDDPDQVGLMEQYLEASGVEARFCTETTELIEQAGQGGPWDAMLISIGLPDHESSFETFARITKVCPDVPIVGACLEGEVYRVARYLTNGLRAYVIRDRAGDYVFLLHAVLEGAVLQIQAERERFVAEKLRREIDSVRKLQESIIPRDIDSPAGYRIVARYESSQIHVIGGQPVTLAGGDYYDAFTLPDDTIVLLVGDASGHGMKACMSIMAMHTLIRMIRNNTFRNTAHFVEFVNRQLCEQTVVSEDGGFITLLYGILNPRTHVLEWTSAGHPIPLLHLLGDNSVTPIADDHASGLPLGIVPDAEFEPQKTVIPPHSRLLCYTDGLAEAFDTQAGKHVEFGLGGVKRTLVAACDLPLSGTLQKLFDDTHAFTAGHGRHDDTSVVLVERAAE